jgi:hypothetical protein
MKTIVKIFLIFLFFLGCKKEEIVKEQCWTCTETWSGYKRGSKSWEVCDVLEAAKLHGRRYLRYTDMGNNSKAVTVYLTNCEK